MGLPSNSQVFNTYLTGGSVSKFIGGMTVKPSAPIKPLAPPAADYLSWPGLSDRLVWKNILIDWPGLP